MLVSDIIEDRLAFLFVSSSSRSRTFCVAKLLVWLVVSSSIKISVLAMLVVSSGSRRSKFCVTMLLVWIVVCSSNTISVLAIFVVSSSSISWIILEQCMLMLEVIAEDR